MIRCIFFCKKYVLSRQDKKGNIGGGGGEGNLTILFDFYPEKLYDQLEFNKL